jgi:hypothetical protein
MSRLWAQLPAIANDLFFRSPGTIQPNKIWRRLRPITCDGGIVRQKTAKRHGVPSSSGLPHVIWNKYSALLCAVFVCLG